MLHRIVPSTRRDERHDFLDEGDCVAVVGRGASVEDAMVAAAEAMFTLVTDRSAIASERSVEIEFDAPDAGTALATWLSRLIEQARASGTIFRDFTLRRDGDRWKGRATGSDWERDLPHGPRIETVERDTASVRSSNSGWEARCAIALRSSQHAAAQ